jgi:hypothetical protein
MIPIVPLTRVPEQPVSKLFGEPEYQEHRIAFSPRQRAAYGSPVARLGLQECQNIPSPLQRAKEDDL